MTTQGSLAPNPNPEPKWLAWNAPPAYAGWYVLRSDKCPRDNNIRGYFNGLRWTEWVGMIDPDVCGQIEDDACNAHHMVWRMPAIQGYDAPKKAAGATEERFAKTYCSQCGSEFGPGTQGYSHCTDHDPEHSPNAAMLGRDVMGREPLPKPEALSKRQRAWREWYPMPDEVCEMPRRVMWGAT